MKEGIATAARMPMMATTIISSMRVNPAARETFLIIKRYSKLLKWSTDGDEGLPGGVAGGDPHASARIDEGQDLDALFFFAIEQQPGDALLLVFAEAVPARIIDSRRHRLLGAFSVGELKDRRHVGEI